MRILLIGEYSNVHWTLAEGLRSIGHQVIVVSNGDFWKDYPRDISLVRGETRLSGIKYLLRFLTIMPKLRGFDVVQVINPMFLELKAERILPIYKYLRKHNKTMFLGGFGMDYYWVDTCTNKKPLRYSDFNIGNSVRTNKDAVIEQKDWIGTAKETLNKYIANDCDGIITGLYEYYVCYHLAFPAKTSYIPFPIQTKKDAKKKISLETPRQLRLFIGINKTRSEYKGTDIMLAAAKSIKEKYPDKVELKIAENVPFSQYCEMMNDSDAILDQLYSYTPSMNPLEAMSKGIICIGGGEPENYDIINEKELRPIINVQPNYESVCHELEKLVLNLDLIPQLKLQSIEYINRHHDHLKVAKMYEDIYESVLNKRDSD